ncbi:MAG TPA: indolepyruvate oxidoreductase subunit beta [Methanomassiliicoccales archaeon]|nr:indolepyruvate oxidoreductase subunit beta [Methanomassiliicoccales archaeon]
MKYNVLIVGVGGQGVLLASRVLGEAAMRAGHEVVMSEVHGMAQRGGSVSSVVRFGEGVMSPLIPLGGADVILGFEPVESYRSLPFARAGATIVTDTTPVPPSGVISGKETYPGIEELLGGMREAGLRVVGFEASAEAQKVGTRLAANSVLLGALCGSEALPLESSEVRSILLESVREKFRELNGRAFDAGFAIARNGP